MLERYLGSDHLRARLDDPAERQAEPFGLLHQPLQRPLGEQVAAAPPADIGVRADEPALLDAVDQALDRDLGRGDVVVKLLRPQRQRERLAVLVDRDRVVGVLQRDAQDHVHR